MSCSTCGATGGRCRCSENDLRDVRDRIDRACRVVMALATLEATLGYELEEGKARAELDVSEDEIVALRARERELLARPVDGRVSVAAAVDAIEEARAEGIAQGRRELAENALTERFCHGFESGWELLCAEAAK